MPKLRQFITTLLGKGDENKVATVLIKENLFGNKPIHPRGKSLYPKSQIEMTGSLAGKAQAVCDIFLRAKQDGFLFDTE